ncbi:dTDP-4-dehydrorhamnose 3,5-epimerase [Croceicoccus bisphenolivorans]|uniref:dTDP-4-dehydrorhamnose 3,5-epimerase n=1 Tax=Croceicoccus bisphenolivorans TaxID=1783232 RepID=UPI000AD99332|nr:dTDP-4-dehydrorhamnose 3,5-epimerase [Croceicoccus bisphenolivorans]
MPPDIAVTDLPGVFLVTPRRFGDARGFFTESWSAKDWAETGIDCDFVQDNHSLSRLRGTLRGLHAQAPPAAQHKLVRCTRGAIFDVAVDIRRGSETYGAWVGHELSAENGRQMFVPHGFLHGFLTLCDDTEVQYKCSAGYAPAQEIAAHWDSAGIAWPETPGPFLSDKDAAAAPLAELQTPFIERRTP